MIVYEVILSLYIPIETEVYPKRAYVCLFIIECLFIIRNIYASGLITSLNNDLNTQILTQYPTYFVGEN